MLSLSAVGCRHNGAQPPSATALERAMHANWPHLSARHRYVTASLHDVLVPSPDTLLVSVHACGPLSDAVVELASRGGGGVALMPCCHHTRAFRRGGGVARLVDVNALTNTSAKVRAGPPL
jgi:hypothetical protein